MLNEKPEQFFASPAPMGEYLAVFKKAALEAESILCITLSSKLSGMHNMAALAIKQAREEGFNTPIELLDSKNATTGEGLIVTAACKSAESGNSLTEVLLTAQQVCRRVSVIGVMDTIKNVYRTGRIPRLASRFGSALNIRPVFTISDGSVHIIGITQNREAGIARIIKQMKAKVPGVPVHVAIAHAAVPEAGEKLKKRIQQEFDCVEIWLTDFSPVMAYATGTGVLVVAYYTGD
jgi:DegV family protein with EDD domain